MKKKLIIKDKRGEREEGQRMSREVFTFTLASGGGSVREVPLREVPLKKLPRFCLEKELSTVS